MKQPCRSAHQLVWTLGLSLALIGCNDSAPSPSTPADPVVYLTGAATDATGAPLMPTGISVAVWPAPRDDPAHTFGDHGFFPGQVDSTGAYVVRLGQFDTATLDSVVVGLQSSDCAGTTAASAGRAALTLGTGAADTLRLEVASANTAPVAPVLAVQVLCGRGFMNTAGGTFNFSFDFNLAIDDLSDSVRGRYDVTYQASFGDEIGHFAAARSATELVLTLTPSVVRDTCPIGGVLRVALDDSGHLGVAHWDQAPCWAPQPFRFAVSTEPF